MNDAPQVVLSIVIRCRNEGRHLRSLLEAVRAQKAAFPFEVLVVDNDSEDDSASIARSFGARVVPISKSEFTYGRAINRGIAAARAPLVLLLSAHAMPIGSSFINCAVAPFDQRDVAACRCLMVGKDDELANWFRPDMIRFGASSKTVVPNFAAQKLPMATCCVLRRSVWEKLPFDETVTSNEDKLWAAQILKRGYSILCSADAVFLYNRNLTFWEALDKHARSQHAIYRVTGVPALGFLAFFCICGKALLEAPSVAVKHCLRRILWSWATFAAPWRAPSEPVQGSVAMFEKRMK